MHRIKFILVVILFLQRLLPIRDGKKWRFFASWKTYFSKDSPLVLKTVFRFEIVIKSKVGICKINQLYHFKAPLVLYLIHYMHMEFAFVYPRKLKFKKIWHWAKLVDNMPNLTLSCRKVMKLNHQLLRDVILILRTQLYQKTITTGSINDPLNYETNSKLINIEIVKNEIL